MGLGKQIVIAGAIVLSIVLAIYAYQQKDVWYYRLYDASWVCVAIVVLLFAYPFPIVAIPSVFLLACTLNSAIVSWVGDYTVFGMEQKIFGLVMAFGVVCVGVTWIVRSVVQNRKHEKCKMDARNKYKSILEMNTGISDRLKQLETQHETAINNLSNIVKEYGNL